MSATISEAEDVGNGSKPARSCLDEQLYRGRAESRRRYALARPCSVSYQALRLAAT